MHTYETPFNQNSKKRTAFLSKGIGNYLDYEKEAPTLRGAVIRGLLNSGYKVINVQHPCHQGSDINDKYSFKKGVEQKRKVLEKERDDSDIYLWAYSLGGPDGFFLLEYAKKGAFVATSPNLLMSTYRMTKRILKAFASNKEDSNSNDSPDGFSGGRIHYGSFNLPIRNVLSAIIRIGSVNVKPDDFSVNDKTPVKIFRATNDTLFYPDDIERIKKLLNHKGLNPSKKEYLADHTFFPKDGSGKIHQEHVQDLISFFGE